MCLNQHLFPYSLTHFFLHSDKRLSPLRSHHKSAILFSFQQHVWILRKLKVYCFSVAFLWFWCHLIIQSAVSLFFLVQKWNWVLVELFCFYMSIKPRAMPHHMECQWMSSALFLVTLCAICLYHLNWSLMNNKSMHTHAHSQIHMQKSICKCKVWCCTVNYLSELMKLMELVCGIA